MFLRLFTARKSQVILREYHHTAIKSHGPCHECNHEIQAGDEYEAYVVVCADKLSVSKFHVYCPDDWYDEDEKIHLAEERNQAQYKNCEAA